MRINTAIGGLFLLVSLVFVSPVLAGGGPVYINVGSTLSSWSNSEIRQIVAKVHLHPDVPCVGTKITFKYEDQKDGDNISTGTINSNTYVIEEVGGRWLNGRSVYDCGTYAKYTSRNRELKYAIIVVSTPKGETYERKVALNFQSNEPTQGLDDNLPWDDELFPQPTNNPAPSGDIYIKVGNQNYVGGPKRIVTLSWNQVQNTVKYNVYARLSDTKDYGVAIEGTGSLSTQVGINAFLDYYVKVDACSNPGVCISSNEVFVPAMNQVTPTSKPSPPEGDIYLKVGVQRYVGGPKRYVYLSWSQVQNTVKYNVYARLSDMKEYGAATVGTGSLSTEIGINAFLDYYVKVNACNSAGCINSSEVFVPRMKKDEGGTIVAPSPSTVITTPSADNSNVEELNKKVENLQNQLDQSKKTQSVLEQRINDLVSAIKRFFPFFR